MLHLCSGLNILILLQTIQNNINYGETNFDSYDALISASVKESFHKSRYNGDGFELVDYSNFSVARDPEERLVIIQQYKIRGYTQITLIRILIEFNM